MTAPVITSVTWAVDNLPDGVIIDKDTGVISGTPAEAGSYTVPVTVVTDWGNDIKELKMLIEGRSEEYCFTYQGRNFIINLKEDTETPPEPQIITDTSVSAMFVGITITTNYTGKSYCVTLMATGKKPITWRLAEDSPDTCSINSTTGVLTYQASSYGGHGVHTFKVIAANDYGECTQDVVVYFTPLSEGSSLYFPTDAGGMRTTLPVMLAGRYYRTLIPMNGKVKSTDINPNVNIEGLPDGITARLTTSGLYIEGTPQFRGE